MNFQLLKTSNMSNTLSVGDLIAQTMSLLGEGSSSSSSSSTTASVPSQSEQKRICSSPATATATATITSPLKKKSLTKQTIVPPVPIHVVTSKRHSPLSHPELDTKYSDTEVESVVDAVTVSSASTTSPLVSPARRVKPLQQSVPTPTRISPTNTEEKQRHHSRREETKTSQQKETTTQTRVVRVSRVATSPGSMEEDVQQLVSSNIIVAKSPSSPADLYGGISPNNNHVGGTGTKERMRHAAHQKQRMDGARGEMAERARLRMLKKKHEALLMAVERERQAKEEAEKDRVRQKRRKAALRHDRAERKRKMMDAKGEYLGNNNNDSSNADVGSAGGTGGESKDAALRLAEKKAKRAEARRQRRQMSELTSRKKRSSETTRKISRKDAAVVEDTLDRESDRHTKRGGRDGATTISDLDALITDYIAVSSSLRAQLHVTQLRIATRMKLNNNEGVSGVNDGGVGSASKTRSAKAAHDAIALTREHLEQVDKDLPAVHTHLAEMGFLNLTTATTHPSSSSFSTSATYRTPSINSSRLFHHRENDRQSSHMTQSHSSPWLPKLDSTRRSGGPLSSYRQDTSRSSGPASSYGHSGGGGGSDSSRQTHHDHTSQSRRGGNTDEYAQFFRQAETIHSARGEGGNHGCSRDDLGYERGSRREKKKYQKNNVYENSSGGGSSSSSNSSSGKGMNRRNRQTHSQPELGSVKSSKSSRKTTSESTRKKKSKRRSKKKSAVAGNDTSKERVRKDDRDEDAQRSSFVRREEQDDLASVYANHPSITYIQ